VSRTLIQVLMSLIVSATGMLQRKHKHFKIYFERREIKLVGIPTEINKK